MGSHHQDCLFDFDEGVTKGLKGWAAGIDEAGRGPLAGPVVAAAVILFRKSSFVGLDDSKKVASKQRSVLFREISCHGLVGIGVVDEARIDEVNIYQATRLAMKRAVLSLSRTPDLLLIDGNLCLDLPLQQRSIIAGDQKSACIAAASIIAKVYRDAWMVYMDNLYPFYGFKNHKGYATENHLKALREKGPVPVHRKSFSPVRIASGEDL